MKIRKLLLVLLILTLAAGAFVACTDKDADEKTPDSVKAQMESSGYSVEVATVINVSTLIATKGSDILTVIFYPDTASADAAKSTADFSAGLLGYTCKQDGKIIYYGTSAAISVFES